MKDLLNKQKTIQKDFSESMVLNLRERCLEKSVLMSAYVVIPENTFEIQD